MLRKKGKKTKKRSRKLACLRLLMQGRNPHVFQGYTKMFTSTCFAGLTNLVGLSITTKTPRQYVSSVLDIEFFPFCSVYLLVFTGLSPRRPKKEKECDSAGLFDRQQ